MSTQTRAIYAVNAALLLLLGTLLAIMGLEYVGPAGQGLHPLTAIVGTLAAGAAAGTFATVAVAS